MQIKKVEVENYRSLMKVTVSSLKTINMLYGYNNTGKSNFIRFIELVFHRKVRPGSIKYMEDGVMKEEKFEEPLGWWEGELIHPAFMFTDDKRESVITFIIDIEVQHSELKELAKKLATDFLANDHGIAHICFEGTIRYVFYNVSEILLTKVIINKKIAYNSSAEESERYFPHSKSLIGQNETLDSLLAIFNDCVLFLGSDRYLTEEQKFKKSLFDIYMNPEKNIKFDEFIEFVKVYQSKHMKEDAANAWRQWPFTTGDVGFGRFGQDIDVMLRNPKGRFPLSSYGTGVQQILYLLAKLFFYPACIVLIEEIELNLSPTAQRELFINLRRLLKNKNLDQVLFTTHSNYFNFRDDFRIYEAILDTDGYTSINRKRAAGKAFFKNTLIN